MRVELARFRWRRAVALIVVAGALITAIMAGVTVWETRPVSAADREAAQALAQAERESPALQRELEGCTRDPVEYMGPGASAADCEQMLPRADWFLYRSELSLAETNRGTGVAVTLLLAALMMLAGATFAGADWASGSMSNQLLFEPRRARVWLAKAGAVFVGALVVTTVILSAFWVALYLVAQSRDLVTGAAAQEAIRWTVGRGVLLAAAGAVGGYALTMLLRHTVGTLGLLFAYVAGGETLIATLPVEGIGRWSLTNNVLAWLSDGHEFWDESLPCPGGGLDCDKSGLVTLGDAAVHLGPLLAVVALASMFLFTRRDIA